MTSTATEIAALVVPFVSSVRTVFSTMVGIDISVRQPHLKSDPVHTYDISGIIGFGSPLMRTVMSSRLKSEFVLNVFVAVDPAAGANLTASAFGANARSAGTRAAVARRTEECFMGTGCAGRRRDGGVGGTQAGPARPWESCAGRARGTSPPGPKSFGGRNCVPGGDLRCAVGGLWRIVAAGKATLRRPTLCDYGRMLKPPRHFRRSRRQDCRAAAATACGHHARMRNERHDNDDRRTALPSPSWPVTGTVPARP